MDSSWSSLWANVRIASRVVGELRALVYDGDPEIPVVECVFALRHGTHCAARSVESGRATGRVGARRRQDRDNSICAKGLLGQQKAHPCLRGIPSQRAGW